MVRSLPGRLQKLRQRFGIAAPRVAVRTHVPWYLRWFLLALLFAFSATLAVWMYDAGRRFAGFDRGELEQELTVTRKALSGLKEELATLRSTANAADSRLAIERTAQQKLSQQIRALEMENSRLREELAIFESIQSTEAHAGSALSILRFKVEPDALPGEYRYRVLLRAPAGRKGKDLQGRLELLVNLTDGGRSDIITLPGPAGVETAGFRFSIKHFQRVEGVFRIGAGARVGTVQVRVYENGTNDAVATRSAQVG